MSLQRIHRSKRPLTDHPLPYPRPIPPVVASRTVPLLLHVVPGRASRRDEGRVRPLEGLRNRGVPHSRGSAGGDQHPPRHGAEGAPHLRQGGPRGGRCVDVGLSVCLLRAVYPSGSSFVVVFVVWATVTWCSLIAACDVLVDGGGGGEDNDYDREVRTICSGY